MNDVFLFENWDQLRTIVPPFMVRCGAAAVCGAMIGLERELKDKPAGFRTNILICLGAAMYMAAGLLIVNEGGEGGSDPARIAAPRQMRMLVRKPAGLPFNSRSNPISAPHRAAAPQRTRNGGTVMRS